MPSTTFIVPLYNEEGRLAQTIETILEFIDGRPEESDVIFVDDGSTDETGNMAQKAIAGREYARLVRYDDNRGKGGAIREGMRVANHDIVFFMDIDLSTPLRFTDDFLDAMSDEHVDIVIGTRSSDLSSVTNRQPWIRERLGKVFTLLSNLVVPGISDFTCGFKAFRRHVGQDLFQSGVVNDWSFDTEILYLARKKNYKVVEIPVEWSDVRGSKVNIIRNGLVSLYQLAALPLRWHCRKLGPRR